MGLTDIIGAGLDIINKFIPDPAAKAAAQLQLAQLQASEEFKELDASIAISAQQADVNKVEAGSTSIFVSGWRPAVGWVCAAGFAYSFVLSPFLGWIGVLMHWPAAPSIDVGPLSTMLTGMLGFGAMRTYEKIKGINSGH